jgi:citrate synthase
MKEYPVTSTASKTEPAPVLSPAGLEGVVVAETSIGDVRGLEGFYHYRQYAAVDLAAERSFADVVELFFTGELPPPGHLDSEVTPQPLPPSLAAILPQIARTGTPLEILRTAVSLLGAELDWQPILDLSAQELQREARQLCALVPTVLSAVDRLRRGLEPITPRADLGFAANYLWMLEGKLPESTIAVSTPRRSLPGSSRRPGPTSLPASVARSARCPARCTVAHRVARSTCSTRLAILLEPPASCASW